MPQTARAIAKSQSTGTTSQSNTDYHNSARGQFRDSLWAEYQKDARGITTLWKQGYVLADGTPFSEEMADKAIAGRYRKYKEDLEQYAPAKKERGGATRVLMSGDAQAAIDAMLSDRGVKVSILDSVDVAPVEGTKDKPEGK